MRAKMAAQVRIAAQVGLAGAVGHAGATCASKMVSLAQALSSGAANASAWTTPTNSPTQAFFGPWPLSCRPG